MRFEGEAFLDPASGRWYGVISLIADDGECQEVLRTTPLFKTRSDAERAIMPLMRALSEDAKWE